MSLARFWVSSEEWSLSVFGSYQQRGPLGPAKHSLKEAAEILEQALLREHGPIQGFNAAQQNLLFELADMQHIIFDIARRAGFSYKDYEEACWDKLQINRNRKWPAFDPLKRNEPMEHER